MAFVTRAAFQPDNIMLLPFSDFRHSYISRTTFLCFSFHVDSFKSTSLVVVISFPGCFNNSLEIQSVQNLLNAQFFTCFIASFLGKCTGCNKCVMFFGTMTRSMFSSSSIALTKAVGCALNVSHKRSQDFCQTPSPNFFHIFDIWI